MRVLTVKRALLKFLIGGVITAMTLQLLPTLRKPSKSAGQTSYRRSLSATTMFDQGSKMMDVAAKAGDLGIGGALGLMSSGSMIISALQAFSARGGGNGEDRQLQALSCQISEVYARLSEKIADSQRQNAQGFSRLDRKIDVLLLAADWNNFGRGIGL